MQTSLLFIPMAVAGFLINIVTGYALGFVSGYWLTLAGFLGSIVRTNSLLNPPSTYID